MSNNIYNKILKHYHLNARDYNYVAIGSAPHLELSKLDDRWDQMIPKFLVNVINSTDLTIRIILIDPEFKRKNMSQYFDSNRWNLDIPLEFEQVPQNFIFHEDINFENLQVWRTTDHRIEVFVLSDIFNHTNRWNDKTDDWFFEAITDSTIGHRNKLIVQEYTGYELDDLRRHLFSISTNKELFKKHVLIDMTYSNDCHCGTDLTKFEPFYDASFDFINLNLLNDEDYIKLFGMNPKLDEIVKNYFVKKFKKIINDNHSNYRLAVKGEPFRNSSYYPSTATPSQIMGFIQSELAKIILILEQLHLITPDKIKEIQSVIANYATIDMYVWSSKMTSMF